jgi:tetratricopeptide (TPR) repeat protein
MKQLLALSLGLLLAGAASAAEKNAGGRATRAETDLAAGTTNAAAAREYEKLLEMDDAAQAEVDKWIRDNQQFAAHGGGVPAPDLNLKIRERLRPVREAYEDFLQRYPNHSKARVAYASFLGDTSSEEEAQEQLEKALATDTNNPAIYNNLANIYGHTGPVKKAFEFYAKAIELNPNEPVYYHNFGTTVYLFRQDAREYFGIDEQAVFDKALQLYSNALKLDPTNFPLASDVAQTYYGIRPTRTEDALRAWTNAWNVANDQIEREGVHLHFARLKMNAGRFDEARSHIAAVTNAMYADLKKRLVRNLEEREKEAKGTNAAPARAEAPAGR